LFPFTTQHDEKIILRPLDLTNTSALQQAVRESLAELKPWMSWAHDEYSEKDAYNFITLTRASWSNGSLFAFCIVDANTSDLLGGCSVSHIHPVYHFCNLGYWVRTSRCGQGIAGRAALLAAHFAFEKVGLVRAEIVAAVDNEASIRVAKKIGAHYEGILLNRMVIGGQIKDAKMFSLLPSDFGLIARL
jgi:ribosomal-protein-serine acetyltransferase